MWRWLTRITTGLSMGIFGLLLLAVVLVVLAGAVVFYRMVTG